jgi:hypothetical protein
MLQAFSKYVDYYLPTEELGPTISSLGSTGKDGEVANYDYLTEHGVVATLEHNHPVLPSHACTKLSSPGTFSFYVLYASYYFHCA